jgi:predicted nucleic acid-binding protein
VSPPEASIVRVVVTDTNILINLIHIGRLDLLGKLAPYSFAVPEEVVKEVREPQQAQALHTAMSGLLLEVQLADPAELKVYADLIQILGSGEAACLSLAQCRQWLIASDEEVPPRNSGTARSGSLVEHSRYFQSCNLRGHHHRGRC